MTGTVMIDRDMTADHASMRDTAAQITRVLVLRRHNHIGDMLCSLPLYAALRKRWPHARIDVLAAPTRYPVPLHALNPFLDRILYYRKATVADLWNTHRTLRRGHYDMAIVPSTVALSRTSHLTAFLSGARVRVGVRSIDGVRNPAAILLTKQGDVRWEHHRVHQEERNREIAALADCPVSDEEIRALRLVPDAQADEVARHALGGLADGRPLVGVHPGAGKEHNIWPTGRFASVLASEVLPRGAAVVITAGALDAPAADGLAALLMKSGVPYRILRDLTIPALAAVYRRMVVYLTNDTGTMHVAAYSGCPTVSLFGPTRAWEWAPRGTAHQAIVSPDGTMEGIPVDAVLRVLSTIRFPTQ